MACGLWLLCIDSIIDQRQQRPARQQRQEATRPGTNRPLHPSLASDRSSPTRIDPTCFGFGATGVAMIMLERSSIITSSSSMATDANAVRVSSRATAPGGDPPVST